MSDPANEIGDDGAGVNWRLRLSDVRELAVSEPVTIVELVNHDGSTLASLSVPSETLTSLLRPHLSTLVELQLDGSIFVDTEISDGLTTPETPGDILQLVAQALYPEMLEDEPDLRNKLLTLHQRLADCVALVDKALADLDS